MGVEGKKLTFKIKKPAKSAPPTTTIENETLKLLRKSVEMLDKIESLKKVELEFEEIVLEGIPLSIAKAILASAGPSVPVVPQLSSFEFMPPAKTHEGKFNEVTIGATREEGGTRKFNLVVGGSEVPPLCKFEGNIGRRPVIAHVVLDEPPRLPKAIRKFYGDVLETTLDPRTRAVKWAQKCVNDYGAKMIALFLRSTDPKVKNSTPEEAEETVRDVLKAVNVPMAIGVGSGDIKKDEAVIEKCAKAANGERVVLMMTSVRLPPGFGVSLDDEILNYFRVAAKHGHVIVNTSPMNVEGQRWLNKVAVAEGVPKDRIISDLGMSALGYGTELAMSAIESVRLRGLVGDESLQAPILAPAINAWLVKEAYAKKAEWGTEEHRGHSWELVAAIASLAAGAHLLLMIDQRAIKTCEDIIDRLYSSALRPIEPSETLNWVTKLI